MGKRLARTIRTVVLSAGDQHSCGPTEVETQSSAAILLSISLCAGGAAAFGKTDVDSALRFMGQCVNARLMPQFCSLQETVQQPAPRLVDGIASPDHTPGPGVFGERSAH